MSKSRQIEGQYVKKQTFYLVSLLALAVGFFGGVMFGVFKSDSSLPGQSFAPGQSATAQQSEAELSTMIASLEKKAAAAPNDVDAWIDLGNGYFDTNQYDKAIGAYQRSLKLQPNNADVLTDMGVMYRRLGKPHEAIEAFDNAVEVDPKHEVSRFNKGVVLLHDLNDIQAAIRTWEGLIKVNPFALAPGGQSVDQMLAQMKKRLKQESAAP